MAEVKGSAITARIRFVKERWGEQAWTQLVAGLDESHQARIAERILPHDWIEFSLFTDFIEAVDRTFGEGDLALCRELATYAADANLPTLYRIFYKLTSPSFILRKAAQLWDVHYSSGKLVVEKMPDGALMRIEGFDTPHRTHCLSVMGWAHRSIELSGGKSVETEEVSCRANGDASCEMRARWK